MNVVLDLDLGNDHQMHSYQHSALCPNKGDWVSGFIDHHKRPDGEQCEGGVSVCKGCSPNGAVWSVESRDPLTLSPSLLCRSCGDHGFVREGKWVPA